MADIKTQPVPTEPEAQPTRFPAKSVGGHNAINITKDRLCLEHGTIEPGATGIATAAEFSSLSGTHLQGQ